MLITSGPPPVATVGVSYSPPFYQFTASGGVSPSSVYSWTITEGAFPAGISFSYGGGFIAGTPTAYGAPFITVVATDTVGNQVAQRFQFLCVPPSLVMTHQIDGGSVINHTFTSDTITAFVLYLAANPQYVDLPTLVSALFNNQIGYLSNRRKLRAVEDARAALAAALSTAGI
jgi:hypothetical protein